MKGLTKRQQVILDFIESYIENHSYPPTVREIADEFGISVKGSYDHIKALEKKEAIRCNGNRSRTIEVINKKKRARNKKLIKVPIVGSVAAGEPIFSKANYDGEVELPSSMLRGGDFFAVNVRGDSMKDAGILDGDLAIIRVQSRAENGEIVVVMLDNFEESYTLKRLYIEKNRIKLQPENEAYSAIYTQEARILGKLSCVIRQYES